LDIAGIVEGVFWIVVLIGAIAILN